MDEKSKIKRKVGLPPGSIIFTGEQIVENVKVNLINFDAQNYNEEEITKFDSLLEKINKSSNNWVEVLGLHNTEIIESIGNSVNINHLILEDVLNPEHLPKIEFFDNYIFIALDMFFFEKVKGKPRREHISIILGNNYIVTFQESGNDHFQSIKDRIKNRNSRISNQGSDYLCHAVIDLIIDNYFVILDTIGNEIEKIEEVLITNPNFNLPKDIHFLKRQLLILSKSFRPTREVIRKLETEGTMLINREIIVYIRDLYDHIVQVLDNLDSNRETLTMMLDIYISGQGNKMNEIMKTLTIIATIFIPLTFIVGVYGMNFDFMPELKWGWSYPIVWFIMLLIGGGMVMYFRRKKWF